MKEETSKQCGSNWFNEPKKSWSEKILFAGIQKLQYRDAVKVKLKSTKRHLLTYPVEWNTAYRQNVFPCITL